jgi:hypothetical protein
MGVIGLFPPEVSSNEDGEKASDARPDCEHCQLAFVQLGNVIDRHVRCLGQGFDASLVLELSPGCVDEENLLMCRFLPV